MKRLILALIISTFSIPALGQNLINAPESVIFDEARNRYIISNSPAGEIVILDSLGRQSYFFQLDEGTSEGLFISGDTLWEAASTPNRIIAYDLETGDSLLAIPDTLDGRFFDSIALDTSGNVYVAVPRGYSYPNAGWIFKCRLSDSSWSVFADYGIRFPQAMRFIPEDNSLIVSSAAVDPARLAKINIADSSVTYLTESSLNIIMDGITFDNFGNTYLSSWGYDAVFRYDADYTEPPEMVADGFDGPTSIYYNKRDNVLAVPDIGNDRLVLIPMYVDFESDAEYGWAPLDVNFTASSELTVDTWSWDFDDGHSAFIQSPTHTFTEPGLYTVNLEIVAEGKTINRKNYIAALADTLYAPGFTFLSGSTILEVEIHAANAIPVDYFYIPIEYSAEFSLVYDSFNTIGCRTEYFDNVQEMHSDPSNDRLYIYTGLQSHSLPLLEPGCGPVLKLYFTIPSLIDPDKSASINVDGYPTAFLDKLPFFGCPFISDEYAPAAKEGIISILACGDVDLSKSVNILDVVYIINSIYKSGPAPEPVEVADVNNDDAVNILDIVYLINFIYKNGPEPVCPQCIL